MTLKQAWAIVDAVKPFNLSEALSAATQVITGLGDLPEPMHYQLGYISGYDVKDQADAWRALAALRPAGAAPYTTTRI